MGAPKGTLSLYVYFCEKVAFSQIQYLVDNINVR